MTVTGVEDVWRQESAHVLGALLRVHPDLPDCEDAAQEALIAASQKFLVACLQRGCLPASPTGRGPDPRGPTPGP